MALDHNLEMFVTLPLAGAASTTIFNIDVGEVMFIGPNNARLANGTTMAQAPEFRAVLGTVDGNRYSPVIAGKRVVAYNGQSYSARRMQVSYVGHNGATGAIDAQSNVTLVLRINFTYDPTIYSERQDQWAFFYTTDSSATQLEIATAFVNQINASTYCAARLTAAVTNTGADYGISLTGKVVPFRRELDRYELVTFEVTIGDPIQASTNNWGTTPVDEFGFIQGTTTAGASVTALRGNGEWEEMAVMEFQAVPYRGQTNFQTFPVINSPRYVVQGTNYDLYTIVFDFEEASDNLNGRRELRHTFWLANPAAAATMTAQIEGFLNPYMVSAGFSAVTL